VISWHKIVRPANTVHGAHGNAQLRAAKMTI
jgi:hypothetical protein